MLKASVRKCLTFINTGISTLEQSFTTLELEVSMKPGIAICERKIGRAVWVGEVARSFPDAHGNTSQLPGTSTPGH